MFPDLTLFVYANVRQEQVLDRKGRNEERRLLAAIQELAEESARLGWASEFSRSHDVSSCLFPHLCFFLG